MKTPVLCALLLTCVACSKRAELEVGSKLFPESLILGEIATQVARSSGVTVQHRSALGGSTVLWHALLNGEVDIYPEYTGTLRLELLAKFGLKNDSELAAKLDASGIAMTKSLGFNNSYAIGMREDRASDLGIQKLSDLRDNPTLKFLFSTEFMKRGDGWPALKSRYALPQADVKGAEHALAYRGLASGAIDATDLYTTDAEISYYSLRVLEDDKKFWASYHAVFLYRKELATTHPAVVKLLKKLEARISDTEMIAMNVLAKPRNKSERRTAAHIASDFLAKTLGLETEFRDESKAQQIARNTKEHLFLVVVSLLAAILIAVPLGIFAAKNPRLGQLVLALVGLMQTIPTLALLVFMIALFGKLGELPAVVALFLYSLLPIVRNTCQGLTNLPIELRESAIALGLPARARLRLVEIPLALPAILAGIKISAVINVGTATLGALIGAGGYGQPILTGIQLDDHALILSGAIPAALLALLVQAFFELVERLMLPREPSLSSSRRPRKRS